MGRQAERLRASVSERLGIELEPLVLAFEGPGYWIWVGLAAIAGVLLFGVVGLGGLIGGALVGFVLGSWFFVATPYVVGLAGEEVLVIEMTQPLFGVQQAKEVVERHDRPASRAGRTRGALELGGRRLQVLPFWGSRADAVAAAATAG